MLKSRWFDYSDAYILLRGTITIIGAGDDVAEERADEGNKGVIYKNCTPFISFKSEIGNTEIDNAKVVDVVQPMSNLNEYTDNYSETSGNFWQYYKDEPNDNLAESESFKYKVKITENTPNNGNTKDVEIIVPSKYLRKILKNS